MLFSWIVAASLSITPADSYASLFSALDVLAGKARQFFSSGKQLRPPPPPKTLPKLPLPARYNRSLEPVVNAYYAATMQLGSALEKEPSAIKHNLKVLREGFVVWLPHGAKGLTKNQLKYLLHRASYGPPLDRFFISVFGEKYSHYIEQLKSSADYLIPARLIRTKIVEPLTAISDPQLSKLCDKHELKQLIREHGDELQRRIKSDLPYLPLSEKALQLELEALRKHIAKVLRKQFKVDKLWQYYQDIRDPFSPIQLIHSGDSPIIKFPSVCHSSIQLHIVEHDAFNPRVKMILDNDGRAILTPRLNRFLLDD